MRTHRYAVGLTSMLVLVILGPLMSVAGTGVASTGEEVARIDAWQIGDRWIHDTDFDVDGLIQEAGVSATISTIDGDTSVEVEDIEIQTVDGEDVLVYVTSLDGSFTTGNSGANIEGLPGRLDIEFSGSDVIRVRDLATIESEYTIVAEFCAYNLGILCAELADVTVTNEYDPPNEKYDFPIRFGNRWTASHLNTISISGEATQYFDPDDLELPPPQTVNATSQVVAVGSPNETVDGVLVQPSYTGCGTSYKVQFWNDSYIQNGFEWYCPEVRSYAYRSFQDGALGLRIDWTLKSYAPVNSKDVIATSSAGERTTSIEIEPQFRRVPEGSDLRVDALYETNEVANPATNLAVRYEIAGASGLASLTTNSTGGASAVIDVGSHIDDSPSNDDVSSNGIVIWDPLTKLVGVTSIVIDNDVVAVDLRADVEAVLIERTRDGEISVLSDISSFDVLPNDELNLLIPVLNRGVSTSSSSMVEVTVPNGTVIERSTPPVPGFGVAIVEVPLSIAADAPIGDLDLEVHVDPDELVTEDADRSNDRGNFTIFVGRAPIVVVSDDGPASTFENITLDATGSFDPDGGELLCSFTVNLTGVPETETNPQCIYERNWTDDGSWNITVTVMDDEGDPVDHVHTVTVLNRPPTLNLSGPDSINVGNRITLRAETFDRDSISEPADQVRVSWPDATCDEGATQSTCSFIVNLEGNQTYRAVATDDDGDTTIEIHSIEVRNVPPTVGDINLAREGVRLTPDADGFFLVDEDETIELLAEPSDTLNDRGTLGLIWTPSDRRNGTLVVTDPLTESATTSWMMRGEHVVSVVATDDDGAISEASVARILVRNVPPTVDPITLEIPVFYEDEPVLIRSTALDTTSDLPGLVRCWDLAPDVDTDLNGVPGDDCDRPGADLNISWSQAGTYQVIHHATDDDGASDEAMVQIVIRNLPPTAMLVDTASDTPMAEGMTRTLTSVDSDDSESDVDNLTSSWLAEGPEGEQLTDEGPTFEFQPTGAGTWTVTVTVTDDDGATATATTTILVDRRVGAVLGDLYLGATGNEPTSTGLLTVGGAGAALVILLFVIMLGRGRSKDTYDDMEAWGMVGAPQGPPEKSLPTLTAPPPTSEPPPLAPYAQAAVAPPGAPPLPATGLPPGWSMEQWVHYGAQFLASQPPPMPSAPSAPEPVPQPSPSPYEPALPAGLLDDLLDDLGV